MTAKIVIPVLVGTGPIGQGILEGCRRYVQEHDLNWRLRPMSPDRAKDLFELDDLHADGLLGFFPESDDPPLADALDVPISGLTTTRNPSTHATVLVDDEAIGAMAAQATLRFGCRHLVLVGDRGRDFRFRPAETNARKLGLSVGRYTRKADEFEGSSQKAVDVLAWLERQPKPLLAFLVQDLDASWFIDICQQHGIRIPEEVAVLGVDDDPRVCEYCEPSLTSIHIPWIIGGYRTALQLHRLLSGSTIEMLHLSPSHICERNSTKRPHPADELVAGAMSWLIASMKKAPSISEAAAAMAVSRQTLHRRCKRTMGIGLEQWWLEQRLDHACKVAIWQNNSLQETARQCGFVSADTFRRAFVRRFGIPPGRWQTLQPNPSDHPEVNH